MCNVLILEVKNCAQATKPLSRKQEAEVLPVSPIFPRVSDNGCM